MTYTNNSNISIARARAPADAILIRRSAVDKLEEDVVARLVRWRLREDDDDEDDGAEGVPPDGDVIEVVEDVDAEGVDEALGDEDGGVDALVPCQNFLFSFLQAASSAPIVVFASGTNDVLNVHTVEMKFAQPKLIPVVTAT